MYTYMFVCDTFSFVYNMFFELKMNGPASVSSKTEKKNDRRKLNVNQNVCRRLSALL